MKRVLLYLVMILIVTTFLTGCLKKDKMENIRIVTTVYPIEYVTNRLYANKSTIESIYPRNSVAYSYKVNNKKLNDYSKYDLFIYNGKSKEREYATTMLNKNKNLKIIDAAYGLNVTYKQSDIWLNPTNVLMIGQNIKNELIDYISNKTLINEINAKYETFKVDMTELETELKKTADNSVNTKIVVADESLNFLKKYGFNIINLTSKGKPNEGNIDKATELFLNGEIDYIFVMQHNNVPEIVDQLATGYSVKKLEFTSLDTLSEKNENNNEDYLSIMHNNIDLLKKETYR